MTTAVAIGKTATAQRGGTAREHRVSRRVMRSWSRRQAPHGWELLQASQIGKRRRNEDYLASQLLCGRPGETFGVLLACDGVTGEPKGDECAAAIGKAALTAVKRFLAAPRPRLAQARRLSALRNRLLALHVPRPGRVGATTLALAVLRRTGRNRCTLLYVWAGDSRVQVLEANGELWTLTTDHSEDDRLTAYYRADGRAYGRLEVGIRRFVAAPRAVTVTTDGIHGKCTEAEWRRFVQFCSEERRVTDEEFAQMLTFFLAENISDNYSCVALFRHGAGKTRA